MKKYTALSLTMISILGLIWAGIVFFKMQTFSQQSVSGQNLNPQMEQEGKAVALHVAQSLQFVNRLDQEKLLMSERTVGPLPQPGKGEKTNRYIQSPLGRESSSEPKVPVISMIYLSSNMQRAVVNGASYTVGDELPNGAIIKEIEMDKLVLDVKGRKKVLMAPKSVVIGSAVKVKATQE